uniref:Uncharacterized protein n=1 Tax=Arundo donax TaxID=35708 RepID=A0A0A8Z6H4_ARUDO
MTKKKGDDKEIHWELARDYRLKSTKHAKVICHTYFTSY